MRLGGDQMLGVEHTEVPHLLEQVGRLALEESGGLDVEHRVDILQQKALLVLDCANRKLVDSLDSRDSLNGIKTCPLHSQLDILPGQTRLFS